MSIALVMIPAGAAGGYLYDKHEKSKYKAYEDGYKSGQEKSK